MVFPVVGGNESKVYDVENSLRFNNDDSPKLTFTPSSAGNRRTFTLSVWFKLSVYSTGERVLLAADDGTGGNNNFDYIAINGNDKLFVYGYEGSENQQLISTQLFRDPSAWYHLVVAFDTTQSTASNRIKAYVNGNQITAFDTANYPSQNFQTRINNNNAQRISSYPDQDTSYFDGYMCEYNLVDGSQLAPTSFGEFDDNGVWIPKKYTGSYGTNGFYLEFKQTGTSANSSGIGADTSGNDNHFTVQNLDAQNVTEDTPTNNFATFSGIAFGGGGLTDYTSRLSNGNLVGDTTNNSDDFTYLSIFPTNMPFYYEMKFEDVHSSGNDQRVGIVRVEKSSQGGSHATAEYRNDGGIYSFNSAGGNVASSNTGNQSFSDGDIIGVAADNTTNNNVKFYHNGNLQATIAIDSSETYMPFVRLYGSSTTTRVSANFGNPVFSISSPQSDDNGYGTFEYDVPSGYYALCTKNLAEFG